MATGTQRRTGIAIVGCTVEPDVHDPDALIARYVVTREWADALVVAGSAPVAVVQLFGRDLVVRRRAVEYHFVAEAPLAPWYWPYRAARVLRALDATVVHVDGMVFPAL